MLNSAVYGVLTTNSRKNPHRADITSYPTASLPRRIMTEQGRHCPFLNRADNRCSEHFSLDQLGHTFDYCFGYYEGCAVYLELLVERRVRRARGHGMDGAGDDSNFGDKIIQVTVAGRNAQRAADSEQLSHASSL